VGFKVIVYMLSIFILIATATPLVRRDEWWIRVFDFPRIQIFGLAFILLIHIFLWGNFSSFFDIIITGLLLIVLIYQGYGIYPYTALAPKQVIPASAFKPENTVSLLCANVLMTNRNSERFIEIIRSHHPDILVVLEPDRWWEQQLDTLEEYTYTKKKPLDNFYGMLLYSKLELINPEIKFIVKDGIPSIHSKVRLRSGSVISLHCLHPEPPSPTEADESTERDAELLIVGRKIKDYDLPVIVAGDLNDVAWSHTTTLFQKTSGLLDPRIGRGMFNTFNAKIPLLRFPLDHIFHSKDFLLCEIKRLPRYGSDHFPIYAKLLLEPERGKIQETPDETRSDEEEVKEKIDQVDQKESL
jgi:endonuclease/exonuclease/phosphatase (EEP) superfamily protein YafD